MYVQEFVANVMKHAGVVHDTDKPLATLDDIMCNPPRGRYDIKLFPKHLSFHGKTFDYQVPIKSIMRLFLLPHKDGRHMFFVVRVRACALVR
jgi:structure-specific recognition protein 1